MANDSSLPFPAHKVNRNPVAQVNLSSNSAMSQSGKINSFHSGSNVPKGVSVTIKNQLQHQTSNKNA